MPLLLVYSRQGCHLCEQLIEELLPAVRGRAEVEVRDIDTCDEWRHSYDVRVPVVEYRGKVVCEYHLDREAISAILAAES